MARRRRDPEIIVGRVNADGSVAIGAESFSVVKPSTGVYTITITAPGFRLTTAMGSPQIGGAGRAVDVTVPGGNTITVTMFATTTAAVADNAFNFIAVGAQQ